MGRSLKIKTLNDEGYGHMIRKLEDKPVESNGKVYSTFAKICD